MQSTSLFTYFRYANASPVCAGRDCVEGVLLHGVPEDEDPDHYHQEKEDAEEKELEDEEATDKEAQNQKKDDQEK